MYATTTTGHIPHIQESHDSRIIQTLYSNGGFAGVLVQHIYTVTEEWVGLKYTDAQTLNEASETSTLNGTTRNWLGGVTLYVNAIGGAWVNVPSCWGQKISTSIQRMSNTNLYQVVRQTATYTAVASGNNVATRQF